VAGSTGTRGRNHLLRVSLNSDGRPHPLLNASAIVILLLGLASFVIGLIIRNVPSADTHAMAVAAGGTGLVSLVVGLGLQMVSATREQRVIIVTGIIAGFVGLALGVAHGAFS
jgi:hypothetical protein